MPTIPYPGLTWVDGSGGGTPTSAANFNILSDGIKNVSYAPAVRVTHSVAQATTTAVRLALAFNTERFDQAANTADTMHDTVTNNSRLTCRYAGVYHIFGTMQFATNATGSRQGSIRLNGATLIAAAMVPTSSATENTIVNLSCIYALAVNDYVELCALQNSGGSLNIEVGANWSPEFGMVRVA